MGRIKGLKRIHKNGKEKLISPNLIDELLADDWKLGKIKFAKERKQKINEVIKGTSYSNATKQKIRSARINSLNIDDESAFPGYNKMACEYFRQFDDDNDTSGQYAVYGGGEFEIKELGYYPDYINFDLKLIMEFDEENYYKNNQLHKDDVQRQKKIQAIYPDFKFRRIREKDITNK